jgi:hypothetical protein
MRKFLTVAILVATVFIYGCGGNSSKDSQDELKWSEGMIYASFTKSCYCIVEERDVKGCMDAGYRKDIAYIEAMVNSDLAFLVRENTKVLYADSGVYPGIVVVKFLDGEYKGRQAYTFAKRVH